MAKPNENEVVKKKTTKELGVNIGFFKAGLKQEIEKVEKETKKEKKKRFPKSVNRT